MNLLVIIQLWLATLIGGPDAESSTPPPPPTEEASEEDSSDASREWVFFAWQGPSINNGY